MAAKHAYARTLRLPLTAFAMRAARDDVALLTATSADCLYRWQAARKDRQSFVLHDGPPYANGTLHIGHALNKILKDIIVRYNVLQGKRVSYVPGWDCHGLPIELKALQHNKSTAVSLLQPVDIRRLARNLATTTIEQQRTCFRQWGVLADWDNAYKTFDTTYVCNQLGVFKEMVAAGLIYRQQKPVHWSPSSRTALAEAELEYSDNHKSTSVYIRYPLTLDSVSRILSQCFYHTFTDNIPRHIYLLIWTTTPWTLPANQAIAIHPDLQYSLLQRPSTDEYYIIATERLDEIKSICSFELVHVASLPGSTLVTTTESEVISLKYHNFITGKQCPVVAANYVTTESGTGLVHTAPGHGMDDYLTGIKNGLDVFCPVDDNGCYTEAVALSHLVGKSVLNPATTALLMTYLNTSGHLIHQHSYIHKYPYDWRTKTPVIQRATPQWFTDLSNVKSQAVNALENVSLHPKTTRNRLLAFVQSRNEWCISRQRAWGVPIPVFYDITETNQDSTRDLSVLTPDTIDHIIQVLATHPDGTDAWWTTPVDVFLPEHLKSNGRTYIKGTDTLDVWFDSGVSWMTLQGDKVADMYLEGSDQHRGWFQSSLLTSVATRSIAPYKTIVTHGFVLDEAQRKMSKSIGNVVSPDHIVFGGVDKKREPAYGVDGLRLWVASTDYTRDVTIGPTVLATVGESLRKMRNTARFMLGNLHGYVHHNGLEMKDMLDLDRYMLHELADFLNKTKIAYDEYAFNQVFQAINSFTNADLSAFYFENLKDRLYADAVTSASRISAQTAIYHILRSFTTVIAPITPILAEEIYLHAKQLYPESQQVDSVFQLGWPDIPTAWLDNDLKANFDILRNLRQHVNQCLEVLRRQGTIKASAEAVADLYVQTGGLAHKLLETYSESLQSMLLVSRVSVHFVDDVTRIVTSDGYQKQISLLSSGEISDVVVNVHRAKGHQCPRCWNFWSSTEDTLCQRCDSVVEKQ